MQRQVPALNRMTGHDLGQVALVSVRIGARWVWTQAFRIARSSPIVEPDDRIATGATIGARTTFPSGACTAAADRPSSIVKVDLRFSH